MDTPTRTTLETTIKRVDADQSGRTGVDWRLGFTRHYGEHSSSTNVEFMTQGELLTLWQQIGALFDLGGMRNGLSDADLERMGVTR